MPEILEGSSDEDEVEDETFGRIFPRSRTSRGEEFFPFPRPFRGRDEEFLGILAFFSAILRTRLLILVFRGRGRDEARNFAPFLGHFEVETRPSRTSGSGLNFDPPHQNWCDLMVLSWRECKSGSIWVCSRGVLVGRWFTLLLQSLLAIALGWFVAAWMRWSLCCFGDD